MDQWALGIQVTATIVHTHLDDINSRHTDRDRVDLQWARDQGIWVGNMVNMETLHLLTLGTMVHRRHRDLCSLNTVLHR